MTTITCASIPARVHNLEVVCLSVCTDQQRAGKPQWGSGTPKVITRSGIAFWTSGWVDMAFMSGRTFFEALKRGDQFIDPITLARNPHAGSGVGAQITRRLRQKGLEMLHVKGTLVHDDGKHESRMHPETRKAQPLSTKPFRMALVTALHSGGSEGRVRIARMALDHNGGLKAPGVEMVPVAVWSAEDALIRPALFDSQWTYVQHPNRFVSDKWGAGALALKGMDIDAMMIIGSDDFLNDRFIELAAEAIRSGSQYVMPHSAYFYDVYTTEAIYCHPIGRVGGGRTISRRLLEALAWQPWEPGYMRNVDGAMDRRLESVGHKFPDHPIDDIREVGALLLALKSKTVLHTFASARRNLNGVDVDAKALLETHVPKYAAELLAWK